jgi:TetR/AcrR family transcriptional regulator
MNQTATTDERVLEVAIQLFARQGYNGTSIRQITREAGANLGAVTYHFGGKRELYGRALERCIGPIAERVVTAAAAADTGDAMARLERVVALFFDYLRERPELPQLMLQETVAGRAPPPGALKLLRQVLGALAGLIAEGQGAGRMRAGDPRLLAVSVISQPLHLSLVSRLAMEVDPHDPESRSALLEHARGFIQHGLSRPVDPRRGEEDV